MVKKFIRISLLLIIYSILFSRLNLIETLFLLFVAAISAAIFNNKIDKTLEMVAYTEKMKNNNSEDN